MVHGVLTAVASLAGEHWALGHHGLWQGATLVWTAHRGHAFLSRPHSPHRLLCSRSWGAVRRVRGPAPSRCTASALAETLPCLAFSLALSFSIFPVLPPKSQKSATCLHTEHRTAQYRALTGAALLGPPAVASRANTHKARGLLSARTRGFLGVLCTDILTDGLIPDFW